MSKSIKMKETLIKLFNEFFVALMCIMMFLLIIIIMAAICLFNWIPIFLSVHFSNNWWYLLLFITMPISVMLSMQFGEYCSKKLKQQ